MSSPRYQVASGGIDHAASFASMDTTAGMSPRCIASVKRSTSTRSCLSPSARSVFCWLCSGSRSSTVARARWSALLTDCGVVSSESAVLLGGEAEHLAEDQRRALAWRQVLERGDEGELDALALLVARLGRRVAVLHAELLVRVGLDPDGLDDGLARSRVGISGGCVVGGQHALGPRAICVEADVGRDLVEPGAQ